MFRAVCSKFKFLKSTKKLNVVKALYFFNVMMRIKTFIFYADYKNLNFWLQKMFSLYFGFGLGASREFPNSNVDY